MRAIVGNRYSAGQSAITIQDEAHVLRIARVEVHRVIMRTKGEARKIGVLVS